MASDKTSSKSIYGYANILLILLIKRCIKHRADEIGKYKKEVNIEKNLFVFYQCR